MTKNKQFEFLKDLLTIVGVCVFIALFVLLLSHINKNAILRDKFEKCSTFTESHCSTRHFQPCTNDDIEALYNQCVELFTKTRGD